jgi:hypothetical protein
MWEAKDDGWNLDTIQANTSGHCHIKEPEIIVYLAPIILAKIMRLHAEHPKIEWGADLLGKKAIEGESVVYYFADLLVFNQEISAASVSHLVEKDSVEDIYKDMRESDLDNIGTVHSHHELGLKSFSMTDWETAQNYQVSFLFNAPFQLQAWAKYKLPCGRESFGKVKYIEYLTPSQEKELHFERIKEYTAPTSYPNMFPGVEEAMNMGRELNKQYNSKKKEINQETLFQQRPGWPESMLLDREEFGDI